MSETTYPLLTQIADDVGPALKGLAEQFGVAPGLLAGRLIRDELVRMGLLPAREYAAALSPLGPK